MAGWGEYEPPAESPDLLQAANPGTVRRNRLAVAPRSVFTESALYRQQLFCKAKIGESTKNYEPSRMAVLQSGKTGQGLRRYDIDAVLREGIG